MKAPAPALLALLIGYAAGVAYFTLGMLAQGENLSGDYWVVLIWVGIFSFTVGSVLFLPAHLLIGKERIFWRPWICGPFGAIIGFGALWLMIRELAEHYLYGGQAAVIGGATYLASCALAGKRPNPPQ